MVTKAKETRSQSLDLVTNGEKAPRLFQLQSMLAVMEKRDFVVKAGTEYGKTLCMVLRLLLKRDGIAISTVTPLKLLQKIQKKQVC
jgi:ATP-dependent helicase YprA (DUF1998 family)